MSHQKWPLFILLIYCAYYPKKIRTEPKNKTYLAQLGKPELHNHLWRHNNQIETDVKTLQKCSHQIDEHQSGVTQQYTIVQHPFTATSKYCTALIDFLSIMYLRLQNCTILKVVPLSLYVMYIIHKMFKYLLPRTVTDKAQTTFYNCVNI